MRKLKLFLVSLLFSCFSLIQAQDYENLLQKKQVSIIDTGFSDFSHTLYPSQSIIKSTLQSIIRSPKSSLETNVHKSRDCCAKSPDFVPIPKGNHRKQ